MQQAENFCQIYLIVPGDTGHAAAAQLAAPGALDVVACVLLRSGLDAKVDSATAQSLLQLTASAGVPLLLEDDAAMAKKIRADGIHVSAGEDEVRHAREMLGADAIIGANGGHSRHDAMALAELGADYIAFPAGAGEEAEELISWWSEVTVVPCVAWDLEDLAAARPMAAAGADFIAVGKPLWAHPDGVVAALRELADAISREEVAA